MASALPLKKRLLKTSIDDEESAAPSASPPDTSPILSSSLYPRERSSPSPRERASSSPSPPERARSSPSPPRESARRSPSPWERSRKSPTRASEISPPRITSSNQRAYTIYPVKQETLLEKPGLEHQFSVQSLVRSRSPGLGSSLLRSWPPGLRSRSPRGHHRSSSRSPERSRPSNLQFRGGLEANLENAVLNLPTSLYPVHPHFLPSTLHPQIKYGPHGLYGPFPFRPSLPTDTTLMPVAFRNLCPASPPRPYLSPPQPTRRARSDSLVDVEVKDEDISDQDDSDLEDNNETGDGFMASTTSDNPIMNNFKNLQLLLASNMYLRDGHSGGVVKPIPQKAEYLPSSENSDRKMTKDQRKAAEYGLQDYVTEITQMPMEEFSEFCTQKNLHDDAINMLKDIRRRGKNKVAAQNCRKRKLDQVQQLETELKIQKQNGKRLLNEKIVKQKERDEAQKSLDEKTEWAKQQLQGLVIICTNCDKTVESGHQDCPKLHDLVYREP